MNKTMSDCYDFWALYICLNENGQDKKEEEAQNWLDWMEELAEKEEESQRTEQEPVKLPCCGYTDASAVKWNPFNRVVQCHNCGQTYTHPQRTEQEPVECDGDFPEGFDKSLDIPAQALRQANAALCEVTNNRMWDVPALAERMLLFCRNTHPPQRTEQGEPVIDKSAAIRIATALGWTPPEQERNFCPRCGKRTNYIHTCTPPRDNT